MMTILLFLLLLYNKAKQYSPQVFYTKVQIWIVFVSIYLQCLQYVSHHSTVGQRKSCLSLRPRTKLFPRSLGTLGCWDKRCALQCTCMLFAVSWISRLLIGRSKLQWVESVDPDKNIFIVWAQTLAGIPNYSLAGLSYKKFTLTWIYL